MEKKENQSLMDKIVSLAKRRAAPILVGASLAF